MIFVVDFDNTITKNTNGIDIRKEMPEVREDVVEHICQLKNQGHYIKIVTARGCLSCNDDMAKRIEKYYDCVKGVLQHYNIPYDKLSFNKEYGEVYLDDSAANPIFSEFKVYTNPNSKNTVVRYGDMIVKSGPTVEDEYNWYLQNTIFPTPKNIHFNPKQKILYMSYVRNDNEPSAFLYNTERIKFTWLKALKYAWEVKGTEIPVGERLKMISDFYHDCMNRREIFKADQIGDVFDVLFSRFKRLSGLLVGSYSEESHGDLTTANIIVNHNSPVLIDPVAPKGQYRGKYLDLGKFMMSLDGCLFPKIIDFDMSEFYKLITPSQDEIDAVEFFCVLCYFRLSKYRVKPEEQSHIENMVLNIMKTWKEWKHE